MHSGQFGTQGRTERIELETHATLAALIEDRSGMVEVLAGHVTLVFEVLLVFPDQHLVDPHLVAIFAVLHEGSRDVGFPFHALLQQASHPLAVAGGSALLHRHPTPDLNPVFIHHPTVPIDDLVVVVFDGGPFDQIPVVGVQVVGEDAKLQRP